MAKKIGKRDMSKTPTMRQRVEAWYTETSRMLNPRTYAQGPAQRAMNSAKENQGSGARNRQIDETLERATGEKRRR